MKTRQLARWTAVLLALMALPLASGAAPAPVPRTGQTVSYRSGDDGDLQPGVAWPSPRFKDHGNGTVTDRLTGLMWSKNAFPDGVKTNWSGAVDYCTDSLLAGYDDWRLPSVVELMSLLDYSQKTFLPSGHPFLTPQSEYWTSTSLSSGSTAWRAQVTSGGQLISAGVASTFAVWPVRTVSGAVGTLVTIR